MHSPQVSLDPTPAAASDANSPQQPVSPIPNADTE